MHFNIHGRLLAAFVILWSFGVSADDQTCDVSANDPVRFGKPVKSNSQESQANVLPLSSSQPPRELANGAEVIVISGNEPSNVGTNGTKVKVLVDRPGKKVLLVLTSYRKITWEVVNSPRTKIAAIVTAGYENPTIVTTAQTVGYLTKLPNSYGAENARFKESLLVTLRYLFGITEVDAFHWNYSIPSLVTISELDRPHTESTLESQANVLPLSSSQPPRELANGAEVIVISGNEPSNITRDGARVRVLADRPGAKVLLVLTSYKTINWEVVSSPQTKIAAIITAGHKDQTIVTTAQTVGYLTELPHAHETESASFTRLLGGLHQLFGITKVDAFRGNYLTLSLVTISELDCPRTELTLNGPMPQKPDVDFSFNLITTGSPITPDFKNSEWSLSGPHQQTKRAYIANGRLALSQAGDTLYKLAANGIEITSIPENSSIVIPSPSNFPDFSWVMGSVALDTKRGIVTVVSLGGLGGDGYLYRFDINPDNPLAIFCDFEASCKRSPRYWSEVGSNGYH